MRLSVVIPAYNEEKDIKEAITDVMKEFPKAEIIVVNDASTDKTLSILESLQTEYLRILTNDKNRGHGYSVVRGLKAASGDFILYIDADRQISLKTYGLYKYLSHYDFVSGWRVHRSDKLFRKVISFCLKLTNVMFHRYYIRDANCPFKIYRNKSLQPLLDMLPKTYIVPIACLEVLARKHGFEPYTIMTPHHPYNGKRKGFLQTIDRKTIKFFSSAFFEVISL